MHRPIRFQRSAGTQRGTALMEFSLSATLLLALLFAQFDFAHPIFVKATLNHAVREGVRLATTGTSATEVQAAVKLNSVGLLNSAGSNINVRYYLPGSGTLTANADPGNIVEVSVENLEVFRLAAILWPKASFMMTVRAVDVVEPIPPQ